MSQLRGFLENARRMIFVHVADPPELFHPHLHDVVHPVVALLSESAREKPEPEPRQPTRQVRRDGADASLHNDAPTVSNGQ